MVTMDRSIKILLIVIVLLTGVALSHKLTNTTLNDIMANKPKDTSDKSRKEEDDEPEDTARVDLPEPTGSPDAAVKIKAFVTSDNECDMTTLDGMELIADEFGDSVYIEFADLLDEETMEEAQHAKISCKSGMTINGSSHFVLPERGLKGTVMFDGPIGEKNFEMDDIRAIIKHLLKKHATQEAGGTPVSESELAEEAAE